MNGLYTGGMGRTVLVEVANWEVASFAGRTGFRNFLRGLLVVSGGALMILPAYLNYEIFTRLHFELVVSLSISVMLFAIGILTIILVLGKDAFERKQP